MSAEYTYRRKLRASELMPALGAALGLGLAGFYFVRLLLQRTPLLPRETKAGEAGTSLSRLPSGDSSPR